MDFSLKYIGCFGSVCQQLLLGLVESSRRVLVIKTQKSFQGGDKRFSMRVFYLCSGL